MRNLSFKTVLVLSAFLSTLAFGAATVQAEGFDAAAKYAQTCGICHNAGVAGAPKKGDSAAWATRLAKGNDALLASVKNGMGAMPAKGMCVDCSDEQFSALIKYMSE